MVQSVTETENSPELSNMMSAHAALAFSRQSQQEIQKHRNNTKSDMELRPIIVDIRHTDKHKLP